MWAAPDTASQEYEEAIAASGIFDEIAEEEDFEAMSEEEGEVPIEELGTEEAGGQEEDIEAQLEADTALARQMSLVELSARDLPTSSPGGASSSEVGGGSSSAALLDTLLVAMAAGAGGDSLPAAPAVPVPKAVAAGSGGDSLPAVPAVLAPTSGGLGAGGDSLPAAPPPARHRPAPAGGGPSPAAAAGIAPRPLFPARKIGDTSAGQLVPVHAGQDTSKLAEDDITFRKSAWKQAVQDMYCYCVELYEREGDQGGSMMVQDNTEYYLAKINEYHRREGNLGPCRLFPDQLRHLCNSADPSLPMPPKIPNLFESPVDLIGDSSLSLYATGTNNNRQVHTYLGGQGNAWPKLQGAALPGAGIYQIGEYFWKRHQQVGCNVIGTTLRGHTADTRAVCSYMMNDLARGGTPTASKDLTMQKTELTILARVVDYYPYFAMILGEKARPGISIPTSGTRWLPNCAGIAQRAECSLGTAMPCSVTSATFAMRGLCEPHGARRAREKERKGERTSRKSASRSTLGTSKISPWCDRSIRNGCAGFLEQSRPASRPSGG